MPTAKYYAWTHRKEGYRVQETLLTDDSLWKIQTLPSTSIAKHLFNIRREDSTKNTPSSDQTSRLNEVLSWSPTKTKRPPIQAYISIYWHVQEEWDFGQIQRSQRHGEGPYSRQTLPLKNRTTTINEDAPVEAERRWVSILHTISITKAENMLPLLCGALGHLLAEFWCPIYWTIGGRLIVTADMEIAKFFDI